MTTWAHNQLQIKCLAIKPTADILEQGSEVSILKRQWM